MRRYKERERERKFEFASNFLTSFHLDEFLPQGSACIVKIEAVWKDNSA
jgi:hypothetical protein